MWNQDEKLSKRRVRTAPSADSADKTIKRFISLLEDSCFRNHSWNSDYFLNQKRNSDKNQKSIGPPGVS